MIVHINGTHVTHEDYERDTAELRAEIERLKGERLEIAEMAWKQGYRSGYAAGEPGLESDPDTWEHSDIRKELTGKRRCKACNEVGALHCAHPEDCGNIRKELTNENP
jgi:hypothetical protein